jgi:predicted amidophosphoribosyltransferase
MKNNNDAEISSCIAEYIVKNSTQKYTHPILVIAVAVSADTYRKRGFNQVLYLAKAIAQQLDATVLRESCIKKHATNKQSLLARSKRAENIYDAFFTLYPVCFSHYETVILVDDVITTGATLNELKRFVCAHGARKVYGLSIAH